MEIVSEHKSILWVVTLTALLVVVSADSSTGQTFDVVRDGQPVAVVVVEATRPISSGKGRSSNVTWDDHQAACVLVEWVQKMTGATLPIRESAPPESPVILIGTAAIKAGLKVDDIPSASQEALRVRQEGNRLLVAGQSGVATTRAVCRLLEYWGCRYCGDHDLGEVFPKTTTLSVKNLDIAESPGFVCRSIWGSQWTGQTLWKVWNGAGGLQLETGHAWGQYVSREIFEKHPQYFALRGGIRQAGDWYCTSQPGLRELFAEGVIAAIKKGHLHPSISPPDGRGYCECDACCAQDDPTVIEPSSGRVSVSTRYVDFFQDVARRVGKVAPDSILSFYCYADYTQAPAQSIHLEPNLCAWLAPIRYCRFHRIGAENCPSRQQLGQLVMRWGEVASRLGYRTYNYNLAECSVPFSMISIWKHDIPFLKAHHCLGINLETLPNWQIYGPHLYLSIRLAYDPAADADAIMDDYFMKFYGPGAGPIMKEYWLAIDRAFSELNCHTGSFYAVHLVYTPEFLSKLQELINKARNSAGDDPVYLARVQLAAEGLKNALEYETIRQAMNRGDFAQALKIYDELLKRTEANVARGYASRYTAIYLERFVGSYVKAGVAALASPNRLVAVLPDRWQMTYDPEDQGRNRGYHRPDYDDTRWREVATYTRPLNAQGLPDELTVLWYRTTFKIPEAGKRLSLFFTEVDGDVTVFVNGQEVGKSAKKRQPIEVDISSAVQPGTNIVAVRVDHSVLTELYLGGIIRPVFLIEKNLTQ